MDAIDSMGKVMVGIEWFLRWSPPGAAYCKADWKLLLGADYGKVESLLEIVRGCVTGSYPDAQGGPRYDVRLHGDGWLGVPMDGDEEESEEAPWPRLTAADVQLWRLSVEGRNAVLHDIGNELRFHRATEEKRLSTGATRERAYQLKRDLIADDWRRDMVYLVGGRFWVKGDFSQVLTRGRRDDLWDVPPFTRMILKVLLEQCGHVGQTSEIIYERARTEYEKICPESARRAHGMEMIPKPASLVQFFRRQRNGKKQTHPLYGEIKIVGQKPATYSVVSSVLQNT